MSRADSNTFLMIYWSTFSQGSLSAKTLFNCRCISKAWLLINSDPRFVLLHHSRSPVGILYQLRSNLSRNISKRLHFVQVQQSADGGSDFLEQKMAFTPKNSVPNTEFVLINSCDGLVYLSRSGSKSDCFLHVQSHFERVYYHSTCLS